MNCDIASDNKIVIFHCGTFDIFNCLIKKFPSILKFKLIITYYNDSYYEKLVNYPNLNIIHLLKVANKGCDIGPFLLVMKFLLENSYIYDDNTTFIKLHTKSIKKNEYWTKTLIGDIIDVIIPNTNIPILFGSNEFIASQNKSPNYKILKDIHNRYFKSNNFDQYFNLYYNDKLSSNDKINNFTDLHLSVIFYEKYENLSLDHWRKYGINEFHRKTNVNYIRKWAVKDNYFVAGTMFGFNNRWLDLFKKFNLDYEYSLLEEGYTSNETLTNLHAWEYYFGFYTLFKNGRIFGYKNNILKNRYTNKFKDNIHPLFLLLINHI